MGLVYNFVIVWCIFDKKHAILIFFSREKKLLPLLVFYNGKKVHVGNDQEKVQSEKDSHSKNLGGKKLKTNNQVLIYHEHI